jgi:NAD(P)-dependent dehydrogenase (short-subunit alcohol dehydrogenase family)
MNILVTGGASGLGGAVTKILAKDSNNNVYFSYKNSYVEAKKIEAEFSNAIAIPCDFGDNNALKVFIDKISQFDLDVLVNNAYNGDYLKTYFHKISSNDFLIDFKENIIPVVEITQSVIANFRKKKQGKIITVLSTALVNTPPIGSSVYVANKAYLKKLTKVWAVENSKFNITSNSVSPSFMETNLTSKFDNRIIEQMIEAHPFKKILTIDEVAETVLFLTSASSQINGVDILLNAGAIIK